MERTELLNEVAFSKKEIIIIVTAILLYFISTCTNKLNNKNKKIFNHVFIKMIMLGGIGYCACNKYIEIALAGVVLFNMLQYQILNDDIEEAMLNIREIHKIERFTNKLL